MRRRRRRCRRRRPGARDRRRRCRPRAPRRPPPPGSNARLPWPCLALLPPNMPRKLFINSAPPTTPAAVAAAVPRNEPPPRRPAPVAPRHSRLLRGCPPCCAGYPPGKRRAGAPFRSGRCAGSGSPGRTLGTEPCCSRLPVSVSRMLSRKLFCCGGCSGLMPSSSSSSRMRASARLSASSCTSTVCTSG